MKMALESWRVPYGDTLTGVYSHPCDLGIHTLQFGRGHPPRRGSLHVEYAGGGIKHGILFICSLFYEYSNLEYVCSADGSTHAESNKLYRKVKHRYRPNLSPRQRPTAKARHGQAALAALAEARGATHRARPRSPSRDHPRVTGCVSSGRDRWEGFSFCA